MSSAFFAFGLILAAASILGAVARNLKQPLILAYIVAGILAASFGIFQNGQVHNTFGFFSELGIAFLLFLVGLELKIDEVRYLGKIAFLTGLGQIVFTGVLGFIISRVLGFGSVASLYIGLALTFSSTIIVVKLLTEKRDLDSLYGKIVVGFLLVQDLVAIVALIAVSSFTESQFSSLDLVITLAEGAVFAAGAYFFSRWLAPYLFKAVAKNTELLFLSSIAWAMLFASAAAAFGFSIEIGSFVAGVGLSQLPQEHQIASRIRPLRDLFIVIFFITLGLRISLAGVFSVIVPAVLLSLFVLIGHPLILMIIMGYLGFRKRTSFMTGIATAQISEFSLILVVLGYKVGHISQGVVNLVTLVGIITIAASSYVILESTRVYKRLSKYLPVFPTRGESEKVLENEKEFSDHVLLVGAGRLGSEILKELKEQGREVLVVDFNPEIVSHLIDEGVDVLFGEIGDEEIIEKASLPQASLIISTMFDPADTQEFLEVVRQLHVKAPVVVTAAEVSSALKFYEEGADYVIIPRILSSYFVASLLEEGHIKDLTSGRLREKHLAELEKKIEIS